MRHSHHTDTPMRRTHYTDAPIRRSHHTDTPTINRDETPSSAQTSYPPGMPLPSDYYTEAETGDEGTYLDTEESLLPTIPEMESRIAGIAENAQNFCNQITAPTTAGGIVWPEEAVSYVQSLDGTLASALDLAHSLLRECKIYEAQVFANFAENLVHSAIRSSEVLDTVQRVMKAGERGLTGSIDGLINTLAHPIVTAKEAVKALTCASFDMYRMQEMMLNDPEALRVELSRRNREFKELIASSSADEILEGCFRFFFDFAIPDAVFSQATKFATFTRNLRTIHDAELALTNRVFNAIDSLKNLSGVQRLNHVLHRGLSPFRTALAEGYKVARFVARKPRKFARKVFGIVEDNPQLITEEGKTFGQVVKEIEQTLECNPQFSHPSMPVGRRGQRPTINSLLNFKVTKIYNREYSAHAIKRINERGITPMIIENIIQNGKVTPDKIVGRLQHYDKINNITVVTSSKSGNVITVFSGSN